MLAAVFSLYSWKVLALKSHRMEWMPETHITSSVFSILGSH